MHGGVPAALWSAEALLAALDAPPSRAEVQTWLDAWGLLDSRFGTGHALQLEQVLLSASATNSPLAFRALWVLALLAQGGKTESEGLADGLMLVLDGASSEGVRREATRALLALPWSHSVAGALGDWAVNVVYLEGNTPAAVGQALSIIEKLIGMKLLLDCGLEPGEVQDALDHVHRIAPQAHAKKKAALLSARLSPS